MSITENYLSLRQGIPKHVRIVLAVKTRSAAEVKEVILAGATDIGHNYVQEALEMKQALGEDAKKVTWHMIGHLQKNKAKKALEVFDCIQTIDSIKLASALSNSLNHTLPVLIEVNSAGEHGKSGVEPQYEAIRVLALEIAKLHNIRLEGLMTMGPLLESEAMRPYFKRTKELFDKLKAERIPNTDIKTLSMGMSDSYNAAIQEGSNMIRLGTSIFGKRKHKFRVP